MNTAISESVIDMIGEANLAGALQRRVVRRETLLDMAYDVLDHDHGVVDHEADRDRKRHQRQIVEAVAQFIEHRETCRSATAAR